MVYLNNASTTFPKPESVIQAVNLYMNTVPVRNSRTGISTEGKEILNEARQAVAQFFNCEATHDVFFSSGSTESLNLVIKSIGAKGGEIITTRTEHNSVLRPLNKLVFEGKVSIIYLDSDKFGRVNIDDFNAKITNSTSAVILNYVSNVTGIIQPAREIFEIAKDRGFKTILDISQAAGNIKVDTAGLDFDFAAFAGHKSLYGTAGIGGMMARKGLELIPLKEGGTGVFSDSLLQPEKLPYKYEAGTQNSLGAAALRAGIEWINKTGLDNIAARKKELTGMLYNAFRDDSRFIIYSDHESNSSHSVFTFNIKGLSPDEVNYILSGSYDIHVRSGLHCAPLLVESINLPKDGTVRVSPSYFTEPNEILNLIKALEAISETVNDEN